MINTRKTVAAGVAALVGGMCLGTVQASPGDGTSVKISDGLTNTSGEPVTHCVLDNADGGVCVPKPGDKFTYTRFDAAKCFNFDKEYEFYADYGRGTYVACQYTPTTWGGECVPMGKECARDPNGL